MARVSYHHLPTGATPISASFREGGDRKRKQGSGPEPCAARKMFFSLELSKAVQGAKKEQ
jgi:hypothetical protein